MADTLDETETLWKEALSGYERDAKHPLSSELLRSLQNIRNPDDLLTQIESQDEKFQGWRHTHKGLWSTLKSLAGPLSTLIDVSQGAAEAFDFGIATTGVIGALLYLIKSCESVSDAYDWIEQVFKELVEFSERLGVYAKTVLHPTLKKKVLAILSFMLRVIGRAEQLIREKRFREYLRVTFLGKDSETKALVDDLNRLFGSEQRFLLAVTYASAQRAEEGTNKVSEQVAATAQDVRKVLGAVQMSEEKVASMADENQLKLALASTTALDAVEEIYARNKRSLLKGTGVWLKKEGLFNSWLSNDATILWIFGGPGVGKSFLTTWIIQFLTEEGRDSTESVAYFFVKENSESLRDANTLLKTLAFQVATSDSNFKEHALNVIQQRGRVATAEDTWENLFLAYYGDARRTDRRIKIILDGLDEASHDTRRTILGLVKNWALTTSERPLIQFAVLGRPSLREDADFTGVVMGRCIEVSREKNYRDIEQYVKSRLEEMDVLHVIRRGPNGLRRANLVGAKVGKKVLEGADGVFLWAKLLLDSIVHKELRDIEVILAQPPSTLDDMIWSVFDRLARDEELNHDLLRRMLLLMTYARRPLSFGELDFLLSLPARQPNFLLWKHTRGKLSSVFDLKYPVGYDIKEIEGDEVEKPNVSEDETPHDDAFSFDFGNQDDSLGESDDLSSLADSLKISSQEGEEGGEQRGSGASFLSSGQLKTTVTFCHTRIRDYLRREGTVNTREKPQLSIIPSSADSDLQMTLYGLQVFQLGLWRQDDKRFLMDYPMSDMVYHLEQIDREVLPLHQRIAVTEGLRRLFGTREGAEALYNSPRQISEFVGTWHILWNVWAATDRHFREVQGWFRDAETLGGSEWSEEEKSWMKDASRSLAPLLREIMLVASREWLLKPGWDSDAWSDKGEFACCYLHGWLSMIEGNPPGIEYAGNVALKKLGPDRLEALASCTGFEKDKYWLVSLGWICMVGKHDEAAERNFRAAIDLDPNAWVAFEGLARITAAREDWKSATEWQEKALAAMPSAVEYFAGCLYPPIVEWSIQLGDYDKAYEAAVAGYKVNDFLTGVQTRMIELYHHRGELDKVIGVLEDLQAHGNESGPEGSTWLSRLIIWGGFAELMDKIGAACRSQGYPEFMLKALDVAVKHVESDDSWYWLEIPRLAAEFKCTYYGLEEEAVPLWGLFLTRLSTKSASFQESWFSERALSTQRLAQFYFDAAVAAWEKNPGEHCDATVNLKTMAVAVSTNFTDDYEGFDFFRQDYAALLWGRWLRVYTKVDEPQWKKVFRARILDELNSFDDANPANDNFGLRSLVDTLFHAGDRPNAAGLLAIFMTLSVSRAEPEAPATSPTELTTGGSAEAETELTLDISSDDCRIVCDSCDRETIEVEEMWFCEICFNVNFCEQCLPKLKSSPPGPFPELGVHVCNPRHDFYRAWPIPEEARYRAAESFDGGVKVRKAWLESLRQKWWE